jgi:hypothetical protein
MGLLIGDPIRRPVVDETQSVIDASRLVSDDPHASVNDLRFHLNAAIYALEEQRAMYRARLRETQQDAKLRIRQAQAASNCSYGCQCEKHYGDKP